MREESGRWLWAIFATLLCACMLAGVIVVVQENARDPSVNCSLTPSEEGVQCLSEAAGVCDLELPGQGHDGYDPFDAIVITADLPPTADAGTDIWADEDVPVAFDGSGSWDDVGIVNYTWTIVELAELMYDVAPSYTFSDPGVYTVELVVVDTIGQSSVPSSIHATIDDITPPVADAGPDQTVNIGSSVTLNASLSTDNVAIVDYTWSFTDIVYIELHGLEVSHGFSAPGTYPVTLTVADAAGYTDSDSLTVVVNGYPIADAGADQAVNVGGVVTFNGSGSSDDIDSLGELNLTWNFTYSGAPVVLYGTTPTFTFLEGGVYNVWLTVRDTGGLVDVDYVDITVNLAPVARAGADQDVNVGTVVTLNASGTTDDMDAPAAMNFTWTFTYSGVLRNLWGIEAGFLFDEPSSYIITLTVADSSGLSSTDTLLVSVNGPPTADAGPDQGILAGEEVSFGGSASIDDAPAAGLNYTWTFIDDGAPITLYGVSPTYVFMTEGTFTVTLNVTDLGGLSSTDTMTVTVEAANVAPVADAGPDESVEAGDLVILDGSGSTDDADTAGLNYTWEFVYDGHTQRLYGPQPTFKFDLEGTYTITLTVRDEGGLTDTDTVVITVEEHEQAKSFISRYWWSLTLMVVAAVVIAALLLMRRRGYRASKASEASEEPHQEKIAPPPDEEEL